MLVRKRGREEERKRGREEALTHHYAYWFR
jgi:hypothetical protein